MRPLLERSQGRSVLQHHRPPPGVGVGDPRLHTGERLAEPHGLLQVGVVILVHPPDLLPNLDDGAARHVGVSELVLGLPLPLVLADQVLPTVAAGRLPRRRDQQLQLGQLFFLVEGQVVGGHVLVFRVQHQGTPHADGVEGPVHAGCPQVMLQMVFGQEEHPGTPGVLLGQGRVIVLRLSGRRRGGGVEDKRPRPAPNRGTGQGGQGQQQDNSIPHPITAH